jgi:uncharacterized protein YjbI with pentapeptide repeats
MDLVLIITIIGVIVAVISLYYSRKQTLVTENQDSTTQQGRFDERFTQAIDRLGNDKLEIRLGAISALEIIANESIKFYWPIMEIFTAYVRKNSSIEDHKVREQNKVPLDIQATLTAIGRRKYFYGSGEFSSLDLQRSYMREVNLEGANLDEADLEGADLRGANIEGASLKGVNLLEANFEGANLGGANLVGANLFGANLERAYLMKTDLMGATLYGAKLVGAKLFSATLYGANLKEANFAAATLFGANLYGANLQEANLEGADLRACLKII